MLKYNSLIAVICSFFETINQKVLFCRLTSNLTIVTLLQSSSIEGGSHFFLSMGLRKEGLISLRNKFVDCNVSTR